MQPRRGRLADCLHAVRQLLLDEPPQHLHVVAAGETGAPYQADAAMRLRRAQRPHLERPVPCGEVRHRHRRQQRAADPRGDHLRDRLQAGRPEIVVGALAAAILVAAHRQRLVTQAVAFVQQQQPLIDQFALRHHGAVAQLVPGRAGEAERLLEQLHGAMPLGRGRQRDQQDVERVALERRDQVVGEVLAQDQPKLGKPLVQPVEQQRQDVGAERRDDPEPQHAGQRAVAVPHQFRDLVGLLQDAARMRHDAHRPPASG